MILIAEDNDAMRELLKTLLHGDGHEVISAQDGMEAVQQYKTHGKKIQLFITDVEMPNLDGVEAYRQIKIMDPEAKVIFVSGALNTRLEKQLESEGIQAFFQKPYVPAEILKKAREILGK
jgi:CheY-like chemotaxis protein